MITIIIDNAVDIKTPTVIENGEKPSLEIRGNNNAKEIFDIINQFVKKSKTTTDVNLYYITFIFKKDAFDVLTYGEEKFYPIQELITHIKNSCYNENNKFLKSVNVLPIYVRCDDDDDNEKMIRSNNSKDVVLINVSEKYLKKMKDIIIDNIDDNDVDHVKQQLLIQLNSYKGL